MSIITNTNNITITLTITFPIIAMQSTLNIYKYKYNWWDMDSVSNRSKFPVRFRVLFQPGTEPLQRVSTQNPAFQHHNFASN